MAAWHVWAVAVQCLSRLQADEAAHAADKGELLEGRRKLAAALLGAQTKVSGAEGRGAEGARRQLARQMGAALMASTCGSLDWHALAHLFGR